MTTVDQSSTVTVPPSLHLLASNDRRGAEVFGSDLAGVLRERGADARVLALAPSAHDGSLRVPTISGTGRGGRALRRAYRDVDVVVAHGSTTLPAAALTTTPGPPFVYRSIGDPRHWSSRGLRRLRTALLLRRAAVVVVLWPVIADVLHQLHGLPHDRIQVIPNAVDGRFFPPVEEDRRRDARKRFGLDDAPTVLCMGALSAEKDLATALRAMVHLEEAVLVVAGDGPQRSHLEQLARDLLPAERVRFLGTVQDPATVLAAADVVALSSRTEGLPGVLIEAGLSGLPAVATDVGGVREIVVDGATGVVVPVGDPEAMAAALRSVLDDPGELGAAARARCERRFDLQAITDQWASLLAAVVESR